MSNNKFKISVIIPIYNVEDYLEETIKSIINQTIGFEQNIQMILVNDGSPDNSEKICLKYKEKYPNNVIYIKQENSGVSVARNTGYKYAEGEYINFLDSDDKWDKNAFEVGCNFLDKNKDIDLTCFRLKFFEVKKGYHALDYKFDMADKERIIDIHTNPECILLHLPTTIIRSGALQGKEFDHRLKICEDTKMLYNIILEKGKYGAISWVNYNYRKRANETSAIQRSRQKTHWYIDTIQYAHKYLIDYSKEKCGSVIKYVQYFLMYEIQWRLMCGIQAELSKEERINYINDIKSILKHVEDDVVIAQKNINVAYKMLAFMLKYEAEFDRLIKIENDDIYINDILLDSTENILNNIELFEMTKENELQIMGNISFVGDFKLYYKNGSDFKQISLIEKQNINKDLGVYVNTKEYKEKIKIKGSKKLEFYIEIKGNKYLLKNKFIQFSKLNNEKGQYYYENKYLFNKNKKQTKISIDYKISKVKIILKEIKYLLNILKEKKVKVIATRSLYWVTKPFIRKDIWLFGDKEFVKGNNAEILFKYFIANNKAKKNIAYFIVDKNLECYKDMQKYGKVVSYNSLKYKLLLLHASFLISSHASEYINNEFGKSKKYYCDLYRFKHVCLEQEILLQDGAKINKNVTFNTVTSAIEYENIINGPYYLDKCQLLKAGFPRHDNLIARNIEEERKILFMPTWRNDLVPNIVKGTQTREYNPNFKDSEYFKFYQRLFDDKILLEKLKEKELKIVFCIHPNFIGQKKDFKSNDFVEYITDIDVGYEIHSSKILVTDYSSAAYDFAYLNKPVIYANFDYDKYSEKCYFDYDKNGFGPSCTSYEEFLGELLKSIDNNFKIEEKYENRMKQFFYYRDENNSKRVYNEIVKLK